MKEGRWREKRPEQPKLLSNFRRAKAIYARKQRGTSGKCTRHLSHAPTMRNSNRLISVHPETTFASSVPFTSDVRTRKVTERFGILLGVAEFQQFPSSDFISPLAPLFPATHCAVPIKGSGSCDAPCVIKLAQLPLSGDARERRARASGFTHENKSSNRS